MKKASTKKTNNDLRPEYDLSQLKGEVRGTRCLHLLEYSIIIITASHDQTISRS
jgi:hypothetical protein